MDSASWKQSEYHARHWSSLEGVLQSQLRMGERANKRLVKGIVLILAAAAARDSHLRDPGACWPRLPKCVPLGEWPMWLTKITKRHAQSDAVGAAVACAYVKVWGMMRVRRRITLSY
jgi:hypothetical protein